MAGGKSGVWLGVPADGWGHAAGEGCPEAALPGDAAPAVSDLFQILHCWIFPAKNQRRKKSPADSRVVLPCPWTRQWLWVPQTSPRRKAETLGLSNSSTGCSEMGLWLLQCSLCTRRPSGVLPARCGATKPRSGACSCRALCSLCGINTRRALARFGAACAWLWKVSQWVKTLIIPEELPRHWGRE